MRLRFCAALLAVVAILTVVVHADVWVASSGSDSNPGTQALPYATVKRAITVATNGSTIWLVGPEIVVPREYLWISKALTFASAGPVPTTLRVVPPTTNQTTTLFFRVNTTRTVSFDNIIIDARSLGSDVTVIRSSNARLELNRITILCSDDEDECTSINSDGGTVSLRHVTIEGGQGVNVENLASASTPWTDLRFSGCNASSIGALYVSVMDDTTNPQVIENSIFFDNFAMWGAALLIEEASVLLRNISFVQNHASYGAGLYVHAGATVNVEDCFFDNNTASDGGAIYMYGGKLEISNSRFINNFALDTGGAVATRDRSEIVVSDTIFEENAAGGQGGAIYSGNPLTVERCRFIKNYVTEDGDGHPTVSFFMGSAIMVAADEEALPQVVVRDCYFFQNYIQPTVNSYGTIALIGRSILIERCQFIDNTAWKGSGAYLQNPLEGSLIVDSVFRSGLSLIGAGVYFTSYDGPHNLTVQRTVFDANEGRPLHADEFERRMVAGAAIATNGPLQLNVVDSIFTNNDCVVDDSNPRETGNTIYGCTILFEDRDDEPFTSSLVVDNSTFSGNYAAGGSAVRGGAIGILIIEQLSISIRHSTFYNNTCDCSLADCFSYGAGIVSSFAAGVTPADRILLTIEDSTFERHFSNNGALWLEDSTSVLRRVLIKENIGRDIVGGVQVFNDEKPFIRTYTFEDCTFDANFALQVIRPTTESGYHDLMIYSHGDTNMIYSYMVGNNRFLNNRANISLLFGSSITLSRNSALQFKKTATTPAVVTLPPILQFGTTDLDLREVSATIECLKLWWSSGEDYGFNTVRVGSYDVVALGSNSFHHSAVIGLGTDVAHGKFILRDRSYTVGDDTPKLFSTITLVNEGRMEHYACNITLDNSQIINQPNALWSMPLYNPPSVLLGPGRFQNAGRMLMSTGVFHDIELSLMASSAVTYQVTNFWKPAELSLRGSSSVSLGGDLVVDSNPMREFSEANNQQMFTLIRSPSLTGTIRVSDQGGYRMRLITSPRELSVVVTNFYPYKAQVNDDGSRISVLFPRPTNTPESRDCSTLFDAATVASLSTGSECSWISETTLLIKSPRNNGRLALLGGVVRDAKDPMFFVPATSLDIVQSASPFKPEIVLVASSLHPSCNDLVLDASASFHLGDPSRATFSWSTSNNAPDVRYFLGSLSTAQSKITIPFRFFNQRSAESWNFSLRVTNTMSQSSLVTFSVQVVPEAVPIVFIEGPTRREVVSASDTQIYAKVYIPSCVASQLMGKQFSRQWEAIGPGTLDCQPSGSEFSLFLPKGCMRPDSTYNFRFSIWPVENPSLKVSQSVTVQTQFSPIGLESVGMSGLVDASRPIRLEVTTIDADEKFWTLPTVYSWQVLACPGRGQLASISSSELASAYLKRQQKASASKGGSEVDTPIFNPDNDVVCEASDGSRFLIPPLNSSVVSFGSSFLPQGEFLFGVTAHRGDRYASELIYLNVSAFPESSTSRTVSIRTQRRTLKTLAQERLVLKAYIDGVNEAPAGLAVRWADELDISNFISNRSNLLTPNTNINLVLRPDALRSGSFYALKVEVSDVEKSRLVGSTRRILGVNSAPANGKLTVLSESVRQFSTVELSADGWVDADIPLRYVYSIVSGSGQEIFLSEPLDIPSFSFIMPFGGPATLKVRVIDSGGAESVASISVSSISEPSAIETVKSNFNSMINLGDFRTANQQLFALMLASNFASDPAVSLREEMLRALQSYVSSSNTVTPTYVPVLVKSLQLITGVKEGISSSVAAGSLDLLERAVDSAISSESVASSLVFSNSVLSRYSAQQFLSAVANVAGQLRSLTASDGDAASVRIMNLLDKLLRLQASFSVADEFASVLADSSSALNLTSIVLSPRSIGKDGVISVPVSNFTVSVNLTQVSGSGVSVSVITWSSGSFPAGHVPDGVTFGQVVTTLLSGSNATEVGVDFDQNAVGSSSPDKTRACAAYDERRKEWDTTLCFTVMQNGRITCRCKPADAASSRISIAVLIGAEALLTPGEKAAEINIGAAVGISIGVCIVAVILVTATVRVLRRRRLMKSKSSAMEKLKMLQASNEPNPAKERLLSQPPKPTFSLPTLWKRAEPTDKFAPLLDESELDDSKL